MSTNSNIAIKNSDGTITYTYCHWDGLPDHNGVILQKHYQDEHKIRELLSVGFLSCLSDNVDDCEFLNDDQPITVNSIDEIDMEEYFYMFVPDDGWYMMDTFENNGNFVHLNKIRGNYEYRV